MPGPVEKRILGKDIHVTIEVTFVGEKKEVFIYLHSIFIATRSSPFAVSAGTNIVPMESRR